MTPTSTLLSRPSADRLPNGEAFVFWNDRTKYATTYVVDQNHPEADDGNPGTPNLPFRTINRAAQTLLPSERVIVRSGVYRERIELARRQESQKGATRGGTPTAWRHRSG